MCMTVRYLWFSKETEEMGVDELDNLCEVGLSVEEIEIIDIYGEHLSLVVVVDEIVVELIEVFQVVELNLLLVVPTPLLDIGHQVWDGGLEINHQVGHLDGGHHRIEEIHIAFEVAVVEIAHGMVVGGEDIHAFEDAAVLDDALVRLSYFKYVLETLFKEIHFKRERPSGDVLVIVVEIRVVIDGLKLRFPSVVSCEQCSERRLAAANVTCDYNVHGCWS